MDIAVLFTNESIDKKLVNGWGVAFLVGKELLFDTGEKWDYLNRNLKKMELDLSRLTKVVISHDHWDHTGGLWELLKRRPGLDVCACPGFSDSFKEKVAKLRGRMIVNGDTAEISRNIHVTGEIPTRYKGCYLGEQALVIRRNKGLAVLTGCAHPGIVTILEKVRADFPHETIDLVIGGFHLLNSKLREIRKIVGQFRMLGVKRVGPTHCSGKDAENLFSEEYGDDYLAVKTGQIIRI